MAAYDYPAQSYAARAKFRASSSISATLRTSSWCCQIPAEGCAISLRRGDATAWSSAIDSTTSAWGASEVHPGQPDVREPAAARECDLALGRPDRDVTEGRHHPGDRLEDCAPASALADELPLGSRLPPTSRGAIMRSNSLRRSVGSALACNGRGAEVRDSSHLTTSGHGPRMGTSSRTRRSRVRARTWLIAPERGSRGPVPRCDG
jgi:hypothetical protein